MTKSAVGVLAEIKTTWDHPRPRDHIKILPVASPSYAALGDDFLWLWRWGSLDETDAMTKGIDI